MTKDESLKLALEILEYAGPSWIDARQPAITAIKEALAQPEQPKVRTGNCLRVGVCASEGHKIAPQRTWAGLTDEEIEQMGLKNYIKVVRETEAALKAKNT